MALTLIHAPQTPPLPSSTVSDAHDYQGSAQVQTTAINLQNGAGHSLIGATTGDLLYAVSPTVLGGTQSLLAGAYPLLAPNGTAIVPSYSFSSFANTGIYAAATGYTAFTGLGQAIGAFSNDSGPLQLRLVGTGVFGWNPAGNLLTGADTGLSRTAAGTVAVGNGTQADATGIINCARYQAGGTAGVVTFGPAAVVSITVKGGIITAIS
jgi:hypothetical protein